jgi:hypothetical protein
MELLPRDEKFLDLLIDQAKTVFDASNLLAAGRYGGAGQSDSLGTAQKVRDLERKGKERFSVMASRSPSGAVRCRR